MREVIANALTAGKPEPVRRRSSPERIRAMGSGFGRRGPLDFLEDIWVNDIVSLVWEKLRLR
jgi:hypothetical protein